MTSVDVDELKTVDDVDSHVTQLVTLDREVLAERAGRLSASNLGLVLADIDTRLGRG